MVKDAYLTPSLFFIPGNDFLNADGVKRRVMRPDLDEQGQYKICSGDVAAVTQMETDFTVKAPMLQVILCPVVFDTKRFLGSISDLPAKSTDSISKFRSRGSTFLHESCHVLGKQFSDKMYYEKGIEKPPPMSPYGPQNILALATMPDKFGSTLGVLDTKFFPDAYRIYAQMSLYPGTTWDFTMLEDGS